jgi:hypothetical protein
MPEEGTGGGQTRPWGPGIADDGPCFPGEDAMKHMAEAIGCGSMMHETPRGCCRSLRSSREATSADPSPEGGAR